MNTTRLAPDLTQAIYFCRICGSFRMTCTPDERVRHEFFRDHRCDVSASEALENDDLEWATSLLATDIRSEARPSRGA